MSKFKALKTITAIAGLAVIGGGAAFAGTHWDGIKKVAQGPVYTEEEVKDKVETGTSQGTESGYNKGYTKGFEDGVAYEPPKPEIKTIDLTDYKSIENCPDIIKNCNYIKEYKLSNTKYFLSVNGSNYKYGNYIFDKTEKTFKSLAGAFDGYKVFWSNPESDYFITYGSNCGTSVINVNTGEKTQITTSQGPCFVKEISKTNLILALQDGIYHITLDEGVQFQRIEEFGSGLKTLKITTNNSMYYVQSLYLYKINLLQYTVTQINESAFSGSNCNVLYKNDEYALLGGNDFTGVYLIDLKTDEISVVSGTGSTQNFKYIFDYGNKIVLGKTRNDGTIYIFDKTEKTIETSKSAWNSNVVYEDENIIIIGSDTYNGMAVFNKESEEIKNICESYMFKSCFKMENGYFISGTSDHGYYIKLEDLTITEFAVGKFDNCKKLTNNTWQLSTEDETQVGIFNEETLDLITYKFVI